MDLNDIMSMKEKAYELYDRLDDLIIEEGITYEAQVKIDELEERISELKNEIEDLKNENSALEDKIQDMAWENEG